MYSRVQEDQRLARAEESDFLVGESGHVKPANARCTTRWQKGKVNALLSPVTMEVDGRPCHVADVRQYASPQPGGPEESERPPARLADYIVGDGYVKGPCSVGKNHEGSGATGVG